MNALSKKCKMAINGLLLLNSSCKTNLSSRIKLSLNEIVTKESSRLKALYVYPVSVSKEVGLSGEKNLRSLSEMCALVYKEASSACCHWTQDVRVILPTWTDDKCPLHLAHDVKLVFAETGLTTEVSCSKTLREFVTYHFDNADPKTEIREVNSNRCDKENGESTLMNKEEKSEQLDQKDIVALGGTFDRMHVAHKILLSEALLRCKREIIVGVTDDQMVLGKKLFELIEPSEDRLNGVKEFISDVAPKVSQRVVPISDPFGPTVTEAGIELIVVSQETIPGANKINEMRLKKGFEALKIHAIALYSDPHKQTHIEEEKISSSSARLRILGERLKSPRLEPSIPYVIGVTGGIGSGKSSLCRYLENKYPVIYCDQLGHEAYNPGTECFENVIKTFGKDVLLPEKQGINRKALGAKVFGHPENMKKLNNIVWPEIEKKIFKMLDSYKKKGHKAVILDAAVLLEAGWDKHCHDVWVMIIPKEEAVKRVMERDKIAKADAETRINSQLSNQERIARATFVFSSLWEVEFTRSQADKAIKEISSILGDLQ